MPNRSRQNQYRGINAHLHSALQNDGGWDSFHTNHIVDLGRAIDACLPIGYVVDIKPSLQIRRDQLLKELADRDELFCPSLVIYTLQNDNTLGKPVTRLELLQPTNQVFRQAYTSYKTKRISALENGLRLVEINYLHESPSMNVIPTYLTEKASFPYSITVFNPIPSLQEGTTLVYDIVVDEPIPMVIILLTGTESFTVDFGTVYNRTFRKLQVYSYLVDYEQEPVHFERYSAADQERIKRRMQAVQTAQQQGRNLEDGPFPLSNS